MTIDGVKTAVLEPTNLSNKSPSLAITWDAMALNVVGDDVAEELATTKPRIAVGAGGGGRAAQVAAAGTTGITITAWQMQAGDDTVVAERVHAVLSRKRSPRTTEMPRPSGDVSGRWDVDVEFYSSRSQHTLQIEQDGNWIQGRRSILAIPRGLLWRHCSLLRIRLRSWCSPNGRTARLR